MSDSLQPHGQWPSRLFCTWYFLDKNTGEGCPFLLGDLANPGIKLVFHALAGGFFMAESPWKPVVT